MELALGAHGHCFSHPPSVTSGWQLEISHGGNTDTSELSQAAHQGSPPSQAASPAPHWGWERKERVGSRDLRATWVLVASRRSRKAKHGRRFERFG